MLIREDFSLRKNALNIGALTGLILSVVQLSALLLNGGDSPMLNWLLYLVLTLAISLSARSYRDVSGGIITYRQALSFCLLVSTGAAAVSAFSSYFYVKFVDPSFLKVVLEEMELAFYEAGYDDEKVKVIMDLYNSFFGPGMYAFAVAFNFIFIGLLASLIIAFFVRNTRPIAGH